MADPKKRLTREEIAAIEVGQTSVVRPLSMLMIIVFLLMVGLVPLIQHVLDVRGFQQGDRENPWPGSLSFFQQAPGALAAEEGVFASNRSLLKTIGDYESDLEDDSVLTQTLLSPVQEVMSKWFGVGNEQAYIGKDGYLFYRPGFDHVTGPPFLDAKRLERIAKSGERQPDPVKAIIDFKEQLAERGIELLVMPTQVKPAIHPHSLGGQIDVEDRNTPRIENPSERFIWERLRALGVRYRPIAYPAYLKTDTHWKPDAMELASETIGSIVRELLPERAASGYTRSEMLITNHGDIAVMLQLSEDQQLFPPEAVTIRPVQTAGGRPWRSREDADVLLLGDSFANIYSVTNMNWGGSAGLAEQLSFYLQRPLDKLCINDNGSFASRELLQADLRAGKDRLAGKKVVIWEFAARELSVGDWKLLDMSLGEKPEGEDSFYQPASGSSNIVRGVVAARSFVPKPGSVPYKDHICVLDLKDLHDADGQSIPGRAAVNTWSMRDSQITAAGRLKAGDSVAFCLKAYEMVADQYESINKSELDDDAFFLAEFCWGEPLERLAAARTIPFSFYIYMLFVFVLGLMAMLRAKASNGVLDKMNMIKIASGSVLLTLLSIPLMTVRAESPAASSASPSTTATPTQSGSADVLKRFADEAKKLEAAGSTVHVGKDGWLFMAKEMRHLGLGEFWGPRAADISRAKNPTAADPLPTILDLHSQLKALGIELIFMPVPPKAAIYADKAVDADPAQRVDSHHAKFLAMLKGQGVTVVDLAPLFLKAKAGEERVYCLQDTHWARLGMDIAAKEVAGLIKQRPWYADLIKLKLSSKIIDMPLEGDLLQQLGDPLIEPVSEKVQNIAGVDGNPLAKDESSPVLILGDSHTLFLHDGGDMHAVGSGFPDLLAHELGSTFDLIGVRGSGVGSARMKLAREFIRKPEYRGKKKVVVWLFAGRDFTETSDGTDWKILPMKRD